MIGRRGFLSALFGTGVSLATVKALVPEADVTEVKSDQEFIFHFREHRLSPATMSHIAKSLKAAKVKGIVLDKSCQVTRCGAR